MCGIVGYKGNRKVEEVLIKGLKTLEYRGYDSAGVAILDDKKIKVVKSVGKIKELETKLNQTTIKNGIMGIAHTRWATHGKVNELNSHPHCSGKVTLVHNGIIENYKELENELSKKGYKFKTETDTERIAALIDFFYNGSNELEAIDKATKEIKGSYAVLIIFEGKNQIYGVRKDAPLILGIGKDENFLTSDLSAVLSYTNKYIILDDNEIVKLDDNKAEIYYNGIILNKKIEKTNLSVEDSEKQGFDHFMLKEINEQIELSKKLNSKYILDGKIGKEIIDITKYNKIEFVACGSAYYTSLVGKNLIEKILIDSHIRCEVEVASEYRYKRHNYDDETLVILISQSGETADTLACLRLANQNKVDTLAIVNVITSTIARESKYVIPMLAGPEICVATTKGYFSQAFIIALLILKAAIKLKIFNKEQKEQIFKEIQNLHKYEKEVIENKSYKIIAKNIYNEEDIYYIGRGLDSALCEEASLKLKEISYIHSECFAAGELKHGPIALINKDTPVISIMTEKELSEKMISNIVEASSRGAKTIIIAKDNITIDKSIYKYLITVPTTTIFTQGLLIITAAQLLAYEIAKLRKCEIDKPRNLAKSVTVE